MIRSNTVFILGAGASCHYGYPTGEGLVDKVILLAEKIGDYANLKSNAPISHPIPSYIRSRIEGTQHVGAIGNAWKDVYTDCCSLVNRLQTIRPLLIDHFLAWNSGLQEIGKLVISASIIESERDWVSKNPYPPAGDHWYRFLIHRMVYGCQTFDDLLHNKVTFINFNYDTSLETHLINSLSQIDIFSGGDVETFIKERVEHVYGSIPLNREPGLEINSLPFGLFRRRP